MDRGVELKMEVIVSGVIALIICIILFLLFTGQWQTRTPSPVATCNVIINATNGPVHVEGIVSENENACIIHLRGYDAT